MCLTIENELKYAKGALKQLRARRRYDIRISTWPNSTVQNNYFLHSNSTEGTDDEGWLSDTKQVLDLTHINVLKFSTC